MEYLSLIKTLHNSQNLKSKPRAMPLDAIFGNDSVHYHFAIEPETDSEKFADILALLYQPDIQVGILHSKRVSLSVSQSKLRIGEMEDIRNFLESAPRSNGRKPNLSHGSMILYTDKKTYEEYR